VNAGEIYYGVDCSLMEHCLRWERRLGERIDQELSQRVPVSL